MLKGTRLLIQDTLSEFPYLAKSNYSNKKKLIIFFTYLRISLKLFTIHRISKITKENFLGMTASFYDYGTFHFLFREIFICNDYYFESKKKNPLILDCGANIGMATLFFKWLYPNSIIHSFEPDPQTFKLLEKNIEQNSLKKVHLHNIAISNKRGKANFYVDKKNPGWLTMSLIKERLPKDKIVVKTSPLSDYIKAQQIDLVKLDVEGAEVKIIKELIKTKQINSIKEMFVEYHYGIKNKKIDFSYFLNLFEKNGFIYRLSAKVIPLYSKETFQDILIYLHR